MSNKFRFFLPFFACFPLLDGCDGGGAGGGVPIVTEAWRLGGFEAPESVAYNPVTEVFYVSNINGNPVEKDGNGYISTVTSAGVLLERKWLDGLNAPKGMAVTDDTLLVADIDELLVINLSDRSITRFTAPEARFLNDVAIDAKGRVYVSDTMDDAIYRLEDGNLSLWLKSPELEAPNGLLAESSRLVVAAWGVMTEGFATNTPGHLKTVSLADKSLSSLGSGDPIGNLDGVEADVFGHYLATDWMVGKLYRISSGGEATLLLGLDQGSADLEFLPRENLAVIPMMLNGTIVAYHLGG